MAPVNEDLRITSDSAPPTLREMFQQQQEIFQAKLEALNVRFSGMDRAIELLQKYPTEVDRKVGQLRELSDEKFKSIRERFVEKEQAVDAAFAAAKEVVAKIETTYINKIDQMNSQLGNITKVNDDKIADLKEQMYREIGQKPGVPSWGSFLFVIVIVAAAAAVGATAVALG